jgi:hypothetical protein
MKRAAICLTLVLSVALGTNAWACGDKMVQIGRGVRYQRASAVRPANIVMFVSPRFDRAAANRLRSDLVLVGHKVQIAGDSASFASLVASKHPDIVLTDVDNLNLVTDQLGSSSSRPTIIPIIDRAATATAGEVTGRYPFVMLLSSRGFDQLALISRAMK